VQARLAGAILTRWETWQVMDGTILGNLRSMPAATGDQGCYATTENDVAHIRARTPSRAANEYIMNRSTKTSERQGSRTLASLIRCFDPVAASPGVSVSMGR